MGLNYFWTAAGIEAMWETHNRGIDAEFEYFSIGSASYDPALDDNGLTSQTALQNVVIPRVNIASASKGDGQMRELGLFLKDRDREPYDVGEIGLHLADGTLAIIGSRAGHPLTRKYASVDWSHSILIEFAGVPTDHIVIKVDESIGWGLHRASELLPMATAQIDNMTRYLKQKFALMSAGLI